MAAATTATASAPTSPPLEADPPGNKDRLSRALGAAFLSHQVSTLQQSVEDLSFSRSHDNPVRGVYKGPWGRGGGSPGGATAGGGGGGWPSPGAAAGRGGGNVRGRAGASPGRGYANAVTGARGSNRDRDRERQRQRERQRAEEDKEFDRSLPVVQPSPSHVAGATPPGRTGGTGKGTPQVVDDRDLDELDADEVFEPPTDDHTRGAAQDPIARPAAAHHEARSSILSWRAEVARDFEVSPSFHEEPLPAAAQAGAGASLPPSPSAVLAPTLPPPGAAEGSPRPAGALPLGVNPLLFHRRLADRIVLDSSILIHSLGTVRKWSSQGRSEELVVPLEALNTLDLLKKGSSPLAGSARAASRWLEDQVGVNPRVGVQGEGDYIPWERIGTVVPPSLLPSSAPGGVHGRAPSADASPVLGSAPGGARKDCPDWIKRTLCSAAYEFRQCLLDPARPGRKSVLAVIAPQGDRLRGDEDTRKWEGMADGREIRAWAQEVGVLLLELGKTPRAEREGRGGERRSVDSGERERERTGSVGSGPGRAFGGGRGRGRKPRGGGSGMGGGERDRDRGVVVEKPPGVEVKGVIKLLARGEKLDT